VAAARAARRAALKT